jgi:hypothetical protein
MSTPRLRRPAVGPWVRRVLLASFLPVTVTACVDFGVDGDNYVCRTQDECASGMKCGAGPSCVCQCLKPEQIPNANCGDPNCENPQTLQ